MATGKCPECGAAYGARAKFCKDCGKKLGGDDASPTPGKKASPAPSAPEKNPSIKPPADAGAETEHTREFPEFNAATLDNLTGPSSPVEAPTGETETPGLAEARELAKPPLTDDAPPRDDEPLALDGYFLEVLNGPNTGAKARIAGGETRIGRSSSCDFVIPHDPLVSAKHAALRIEGGTLAVEDLGSSNGTLLQVRGPRRVGPGDVLILGGTLVRVGREG